VQGHQLILLYRRRMFLDTLNGVDVMGTCHNPINPDIELWIGAIERIEKPALRG